MVGTNSQEKWSGYIKKRVRFFVAAGILAHICLTFIISLMNQTPRQNWNYDSLEYDNIALSLTKGEGYKLAIPWNERHITYGMRRSPLYPFLLAGVFSFFGHNYVIIYLIQAILYTCTGLLIYHLAQRIYDDRKISGLAIAFFLCYVPYYIYVGKIMTEIVTTFLLVLTLALLLKAIDKRSSGYFFFSGFALGLTILARPVFFLFPPVAAVFIFFRLGKKPGKLLFILLFLVAAFGTVTPWIYRNYTITGKFLLASNSGQTLWDGTELSTLGNYPPLFDQDPPRIAEKLKGIPLEMDWKRDEIYRSEAINNLKQLAQNPLEFTRFLGLKFFRFWFVNRRWDNSMVDYLYLSINGLLLLFAVLGCVRYYRVLGASWVLLAVVLYLNGVHLFYFSWQRYNLPVMPFVLIYAAVGLLALFKRMNKLSIHVTSKD